jgi:hypothetical protein
MRHVQPSGSRGQTWRTFIRNHSGDIWACDFLQLYDVFFRPLFAFFFVVHRTREVIHFNVTLWPTDLWAAQQLREATPFGAGPRYLIRDNDDKLGKRFATVAEGTEIAVAKIPPRSPILNPICERFLGSVRRECLDHVVILNERQLRSVLNQYVEIYFNRARPHQGLRQRIPVPRSPSGLAAGLGRHGLLVSEIAASFHDAGEKTPIFRRNVCSLRFFTLSRQKAASDSIRYTPVPIRPARHAGPAAGTGGIPSRA